MLVAIVVNLISIVLFSVVGHKAMIEERYTTGLVMAGLVGINMFLFIANIVYMLVTGT